MTDYHIEAEWCIFLLVNWIINNSSNGLSLVRLKAIIWTNTGVYRQVSNIRRTLVGNKIVDNSDVVGASPVGAAPPTSSLST